MISSRVMEPRSLAACEVGVVAPSIVGRVMLAVAVLGRVLSYLVYLDLIRRVVTHGPGPLRIIAYKIRAPLLVMNPCTHDLWPCSRRWHCGCARSLRATMRRGSVALPIPLRGG